MYTKTILTFYIIISFFFSSCSTKTETRSPQKIRCKIPDTNIYYNYEEDASGDKDLYLTDDSLKQGLYLELNAKNQITSKSIYSNDTIILLKKFYWTNNVLDSVQIYRPEKREDAIYFFLFSTNTNLSRPFYNLFFPIFTSDTIVHTYASSINIDKFGAFVSNDVQDLSIDWRKNNHVTFKNKSKGNIIYTDTEDGLNIYKTILYFIKEIPEENYENEFILKTDIYMPIIKFKNNTQLSKKILDNRYNNFQF